MNKIFTLSLLIKNMYAIYALSIYQIYVYRYLYQAISKFFKFKRGKWGRYLWRHFYRREEHIIVTICDQGGGGVWKS